MVEAGRQLSVFLIRLALSCGNINAERQFCFPRS